jgi:hypothetical protein
VRSANGQPKHRCTTKGWELLVEWKDGSVSWIPLKDLKETNPVEVAEYAIANKIKKEPAFAWWVNFVTRKRERIIAKLQKKYWRTDYKFGVRLPKSVDEALQVSVAYKAKEGVRPDDVRNGKVADMKGFQEIKCHIVFSCFVDANHAGNVITRRSHTGILLFVQNAPILWFSKKQNTVE